jgi:hypothetical protein
MKSSVLVAPALILLACGQSQPEQNPRQPTPVRMERSSAPARQPQSNETANFNLPDERTRLPEPRGVIDPKSAEAAGQLVQHYGALIEQGHWSDAWKLWNDSGAAKAFDRNWQDDSEIHMEIGKPGDMEGAAGSTYLTVPAVFYGKSKTGASFRRAADVILRRVNDVPGSTEAQRRWHIERIDWRP